MKKIGSKVDSERSLQIELMKWNVERLEVANLSIIQRATNCVGFSVVELGLLANSIFSSTSKSNFVKDCLDVAVGFAGIALVLFIQTVLTKSDGEPYENKDFVGKSGEEILQMLHNTCGDKVSEECLQTRENVRRSKHFSRAIYCLAFSVLPIVVALAQQVFK